MGRHRQHQFLLLMVLTLISTFMEVVSIGAVLPFLSVLIDPEKVFNYPLIKDHAPLFAISSAEQLILPLTVGFIIFSLISGGIRLLLLWASTKFAFANGADLSIEMYRRTLYQPYSVHISRNSSEVVSGIISKVNGVVFSVILPMLALISSVVLLIAITLTLLFINVIVAITVIFVFGGCYLIITSLSRHRLKKNGKLIAYEQTQVVRALQEGLGGIRDVLLDGTQAIYCEIYEKADRPFRKAYGNNTFIGGSPRFVMEALGMVLIACLAYVLSQQSGGISSALPLLGALALGAQRILPAMQQGYSAWATITANQAILADTISFLNQSLPDENEQIVTTPISFEKSVCLSNIRFRYTNDSPWVLDGFNLEIYRGSRIGIIGSSGSGKSTAIDILMGLLTPTEGMLLIDGNPCYGAQNRLWQKMIAHVPQSIYLTDATIEENIAFGVPRALIDKKRVRFAARQAQIADFIESRPEGYNAKVGERGIRLSGGQRQRIGIARALYKQAKILVFDEATSALDAETELSVMDSIDSLDRGLTIILVAHRITTLSRCDKIVEFGCGRVISECTYQELFSRSP